jgi:hypothetical protein
MMSEIGRAAFIAAMWGNVLYAILKAIEVYIKEHPFCLDTLTSYAF